MNVILWNTPFFFTESLFLQNTHRNNVYDSYINLILVKDVSCFSKKKKNVMHMSFW